MPSGDSIGSGRGGAARPLSILFLESSGNFGGQERRLLFEARWLAAGGHSVAVACPGETAVYGRCRESGLETHPVPMRGSIHPGSIGALVRIVRRHRTEILYSHSGKDSWLGGIAGSLCGVPLVRSRELLTPIRHARSYDLFPKRVLACSEAVKRHLLESGVREEKVFVQYPPVNTAGFASVSPSRREKVREELRLDGHRPVIACVGEFRAEKRQVDLVIAMKLLRERLPFSLLLLAGRDTGVTGVRSAAEREGVLDRVRFLGDREDVPAILANADVCVFPSSVEPFGMGPVEAMAAGVPVVVTKVGGLAEIVTDGVNGLQVPPFDPEAIRGAVLRIAEDPDLRGRLAEAGRARAQEFDADKAMRNLERHFLEVAGE